MLVRYLVAAALWLIWFVPFVMRNLKGTERAVVRDRGARWGILIEAIGIGIAWGVPQFEVSVWRMATGILFAVVADFLAWAAIRHLGRQFRVDAGLNADHELVRSGPYALVRHPIYASMFAMLIATGLLIAQWAAILGAGAIYIIGTEIRVRSEERLLRGRFGAAFDDYASRVSAYIPFVR